MQFWPGVRPNQRQRALGNYLYRATVGRTVQKYGQRLLDRYGNYTVKTLKGLGAAAGALPGNTTKTTKTMAYMKYGRTGRRAGGTRKRWVRRSYVGRKRRRGTRIPTQLRRYITKLANSGKERLHKSYAGAITSEAQAADGAASCVWTYYKDMSDMQAFRFRQGADTPGGDDQVNFANEDNPWGFQSIPLFNGDYIFMKKTSLTLEITLNNRARNLTDNDAGATSSEPATNFPWIVRVIVFKPRDSGESDEFDLFRTLNGDKIGFESYRTPSTGAQAQAQQLDMRNMVTKGLLNKKDFVVVKDTRFQLGAGTVAACVSKKIPITFTFNKNEKISADPTNTVVDLADIADGNNDNARRARYYNYRFMIMAVPTIPQANIIAESPINVTYHGVTLGHD